jgi:hypothetical protein
MILVPAAAGRNTRNAVVDPIPNGKLLKKGGQASLF